MAHPTDANATGLPEGIPPPPVLGGGGGEQPRYIGLEPGYLPESSSGGQPFSPRQADREFYRQPLPMTPLYIEGMELDPAGMSGEDIEDLQLRMTRAGLLKPKKYKRGIWFGESVSAYRRLLAYANSKALDHETALDELIEQGGVGDEEGADGPFTGTRTRTDRRVNLTNPQTARVALRRLLREELGRAPKPNEVSAFLAALNSAEQQNASVTTTTESYVDGIGTGSSSTTSGGLDADAFMEEHLDNVPELDAEKNSFTRDTDYYQAAMSVLGEGGGRG